VKDWAATKQMLTCLSRSTKDHKRTLEKSKKKPPFQAVKLKEDLSWETVRIELQVRDSGIMPVAPRGPMRSARPRRLGYQRDNEKELKEREAKGARTVLAQRPHQQVRARS
jgi:hypothetical protein